MIGQKEMCTMKKKRRMQDKGETVKEDKGWGSPSYSRRGRPLRLAPIEQGPEG